MSLSSLSEAHGTVSQFLDSARNGDAEEMKKLLKSHEIDINCKGTQKKNYGWTALHLASYFGHEEVVAILLERGADVNSINATGDSALHKAALSDRIGVIQRLLAAEADVNVVNAEGLTPKQLTESTEILNVFDAASKSDQLKMERKLFDAAREGKIDDVLQLLQPAAPSSLSSANSTASSSYQKSGTPNVNCADILGNRPLHYATLASNRKTVVLLLQLGANPQLTNKRGLRAVDLSKDPLITQMLEVKSLKELSNTAKLTEGVLIRKGRIRGSREQWVVLENGTLSLYLNKEAALKKRREKSGRFLAGSRMEGELGKDSFLLRFSNKSKLHFSVPKGENAQITRQKWINSFKDHIDHANRLLDAELKRANQDEDGEDATTIGLLQSSIENIRAYDQLLRRQLEDVNKVQAQLRQEQRTVSALSPKLQECIQELDGKVSHLVGLSVQMCTDLSSCVNIMSQREELYRKEIDEEKRRNKILEESLQAVAKEAKHLETSLQTFRSTTFVSDEALPGAMAASKNECDSEDSSDETAYFDCPSPEVEPGTPSSPDSISYLRETGEVAAGGKTSKKKPENNQRFGKGFGGTTANLV